MVKFGYSILYVQNLTSAISFYEEAFGFKRKFIKPDNSFGELNTGNVGYLCSLGICSCVRGVLMLIKEGEYYRNHQSSLWH